MRSDRDRIVVFNAGSSSLKVEAFAVRPWRSLGRAVVEGFDGPRPMLRIDGGGEPHAAAARDHASAASAALDALARAAREPFDEGTVAATGHRVVHGGAEFSAPVVVDDAVLAKLEALAPLAPLHNPPALAVLGAVRRRLGAAPAIATFDTAFFSSLPEHVRAYAIPAEWRRGGALRRYGFHGIAHEELHARYRELTRRAPRPERVIGLHLGQGCSAAASLDGLAVETSMGYTPLEGLVMGTRPGDLDAGVLVALARDGLSVDELDAGLNHRSGLLGLSETSSDMRALLAAEEQDARAALALAAFCHRATKYVGAYAAVLGGVDALLFGGGIGEHSAAIRARICASLRWLGLELDAAANERCVGREGAITAPDSGVEAFVVQVREEHAIARAVCACLAIDPGDRDA